MIDRDKFLEVLARSRRDEIVVYTMSMVKHWPEISDSALDFYVGGAMGYTSSVGLGVAVARPDRRVIVMDGDGSLLMNLGSLVTIANQSQKNLVHILFQNNLYELSGRVPVPGIGTKSFAGLARAAGYAAVYEFDELTSIEQWLPEILAADGPTFVLLHTAPGNHEPMKAVQVVQNSRGAAHRMAAVLGGHE